MPVNAVGETTKDKIIRMTASAAGLGTVGAIAGAVIGKRPTLEEVFALEPDSFHKVVEDVTDKSVKEAATKIGEKINILNEGEFVADSSKFDAEVLKKINETKDNSSRITRFTDASEDELRAAKEAVRTDKNLKQITDEYDRAVETVKSKRAAKISELAGDQEYKTAFGKIKKLFPKGQRGKMALIYGGIAAAVALVLNFAAGFTKKGA